jgi:hypothetical protein
MQTEILFPFMYYYSFILKYMMIEYAQSKLFRKKKTVFLFIVFWNSLFLFQSFPCFVYEKKRSNHTYNHNICLQIHLLLFFIGGTQHTHTHTRKKRYINGMQNISLAIFIQYSSVYIALIIKIVMWILKCICVTKHLNREWRGKKAYISVLYHHSSSARFIYCFMAKMG